MIVKGKKHGNELPAVFDGDSITVKTICGKVFEKVNTESFIKVFDFLSGSIDELEKWLSFGGSVRDQATYASGKSIEVIW